MKYYLLFFFLINFFEVNSQNIYTSEGVFMDTSSIKNPACNEHTSYFYNLHLKYPESSATLLKEVQDSMAVKLITYTGNGYVTFQFVIDCEGKMLNNVRVLQTDENYISFQFEKTLVNDLFAFLKTLDKWQPGRSPDNEPVNYKSFISFKIHDGKVINIIP